MPLEGEHGAPSHIFAEVAIPLEVEVLGLPMLEKILDVCSVRLAALPLLARRRHAHTSIIRA
jgi:hypothetical protein